MDNFPRQKLCELINRHGTILCEDIERCEILLTQVCTKEQRREIFILINAAKEGVTKKILTHKLLADNLIKELAEQLHNNLCFEIEAATWAVQSWVIALTATDKKNITNKNEMVTPLFEKIDQSKFKQLYYLNPLDYFRLLWWVLVSPQQLKVYRRIFGQESEQKIGNWLVSSLIWFPLLIPNLALGLKQLPYSDKAWLPEIYLLLSILLMFCWLVISKLKVDKSISISIAMLSSVIIAALVAVSITGIIVGLLPFIITFHWLILVLIVLASMFIIINAVLLSFLIASDIIIAVAGIVAIGIAVGIAGSVAILTMDFILGFGAALLAGFVASFGVDFITNKMKNAIEITLNTGVPSFLGRINFLLLIFNYGFLISLLYIINVGFL
ncbi:MAG: hypothetical protein KAH84_07475 [Thiomargarita sp.]|nr:hypothetical protein [Thiomargarita sp.]